MAVEKQAKERLALERQASKFEEFHSWECISLVLASGHTLDFVVKDEGHMMALLNILGRSVYGCQDGSFLKLYMQLKFKAKLGYECWRKHKSLRSLVMQAILQSVKEMALISANKLNNLLIHADGVP